MLGLVEVFNVVPHIHTRHSCKIPLNISPLGRLYSSKEALFKVNVADKEIIVLVADDDENARLIVSQSILSLGYTVVEAKDGNEAMTCYEECAPSLIILDVMMPGLSGNQVCEQIKKSQRGVHIPVLMLTACDGLQDKILALDGGADDYVTKPFHFEELQARVKALLRVRELNVKLEEKNQELLAVQERLVQQERKLLAVQLAGTAAHELGQPLSTIILHCHLLERRLLEGHLPERQCKNEEQITNSINAIKVDALRMKNIIEKLKNIDTGQKKNYYGEAVIFPLEIDET